MRIRLIEGTEIPPPPFTIRVVEIHDESIVLEFDSEIQVEMFFDDWGTPKGTVVPIGGKDYYFQSGGKSLQPAQPQVKTLTRPRSAESYRTASVAMGRRGSSPGPRSEGDVYFIFRYSLIKKWTEVEIELNPDVEPVPVTMRLGFRFIASSATSILLTTVDLLAEQDIVKVEVADTDEEDSMGRLFTHTALQYVIQGQGEDEKSGLYRFRFAEIQFPPDDQDKPCGACGDK
jgi:hypothetical protein